MAQVLIRGLDERVVEAVRREAAWHGHSLEQELRGTLTQAARPTPQERLRIARDIRAMTPEGVVQTDSADLIRQYRDSQNRDTR
jgi:plasmid stability protein